MAIIVPRKPQKPHDSGPGLGQSLGAIGTVAGGIIGSIIPGAGTMAGAGVGGAIGSTVGTLADMSKPKEDIKEQPDLALQSQVPDNAMSRRLESMQAQNQPLNDVIEAGVALNKMPPEIQQEYKPALMSTYARMKGVRA